jgi:putative oxidoreductase
MNNRGLFIAARVLIPSVFVGLGLERLLVGAGVLAGAPVSAGAVVFSAFELIAGLLVMLGWQVRWVASLLALFILVDAFLAHAFWTYLPAERHGQLLHFLKNLSTLGGLVLLAWLDGVPALGAPSKSGTAGGARPY